VSRVLIDTHAHLDGDAFAADLDAVLERARDAGVARMVTAGQDEVTSRAALELAARHPSVIAAVGVHPHEAKGAGDLQWLEPLARTGGVVAVGEIGLDYHYDFSPRDVQRDVFARQLKLAGRLGLPAIIHCREAEDDVAATLREHFDHSRRAVIHCWTGTYGTAMRFIDEFDVYLGLGGAVTFKGATDLHDAAARLPLDRIVLETDCPYMTPAPFRGKRNEPAYTTLTCRRVAELRGVSEDDIAAATTSNAQRLFPGLDV
jgi:TatD DNase family protein